MVERLLPRVGGLGSILFGGYFFLFTGEIHEMSKCKKELGGGIRNK